MVLCSELSSCGASFGITLEGTEQQFARPLSFVSSYGNRSEEALAELRGTFFKESDTRQAARALVSASVAETIYTFFLNYEQYIILLTIWFFAGMAWRHHRLIMARLLHHCRELPLWVIYVYRYQIAVGWPALGASGELSLRELFSNSDFIGHSFYLLYLPQLLAEHWVLHLYEHTPAGPSEAR